MTDGPLQVRAEIARGSFSLDVEFDVVPGEVVALVGPSGAGKSTCLSAIAGLLGLNSGRISLAGEIWCDTSRGIDWPAYKRQVGLVPQDYALFPNLNVRENISYGAKRRFQVRHPASSAGNAWMDKLGISALGDRTIPTLSGGEKQRVALARALASGARVLLLDEPFGSLDAATRCSVRAQLSAFLQTIQFPTILVTHDPTDSLVLADRIATIENGRITQIGTCQELLTRPRTQFIAGLFGLNFFRVELSRGDVLGEARIGNIVLHVIDSDHAGQAFVAFPPSAVTLSRERPSGSAHNVFKGRIRETSRLVDRMRVLVDCGIPVAADVAPDAATNLELNPGQSIWVSVKSTAIQTYSA